MVIADLEKGTYGFDILSFGLTAPHGLPWRHDGLEAVTTAMIRWRLCSLRLQKSW